MYEKLATTAGFIQKKYSRSPKVGIVLGSGLGSFIDQIENIYTIPYDQIPFFHQTTVEGHEGRLIFGQVKGVEVAILQGRLHGYEGLPMEDVVFPVRALATLGIETLILTNASGGVNESYSPGDLVLIDDHINMLGTNPLVGPNISEFGPRFPDMSQAYDPETKEIILSCAKELDTPMKKGVYCAMLGPTYETPAEVKMLRIMGVDMVGMSTVPEAIAGNHLGLKVAGISCITNMAAGITSSKLEHEHVKDQALKVMDTFSTILSMTIEKIGN